MVSVIVQGCLIHQRLYCIFPFQPKKVLFVSHSVSYFFFLHFFFIAFYLISSKMNKQNFNYLYSLFSPLDKSNCNTPIISQASNLDKAFQWDQNTLIFPLNIFRQSRKISKSFYSYLKDEKKKELKWIIGKQSNCNAIVKQTIYY